VNGVYPPGVFDVFEGNTQFCVCQCDALELLDGLPPESIDAVITDAPYSSGGAFRGDRVGSTKTKSGALPRRLPVVVLHDAAPCSTARYARPPPPTRLGRILAMGRPEKAAAIRGFAKC
jgi:hypothetical protein